MKPKKLYFQLQDEVAQYKLSKSLARQEKDRETVIEMEARISNTQSIMKKLYDQYYPMSQLWFSSLSKQ